MVIICNDVYEIFKSLKVYPYGSKITYPNIFYMTNVVCY